MEVVVEYDYVAEESDELTIKKGDIIKEVSQFEDGWFLGTLDGRIGVFPDNFVKVLPSIQPKISPIVIAEPINESVNGDNTVNHDLSIKSHIQSKQKPAVGIGFGNIFSGQPIHLKQTSLKEVVKENETTSEKTSSSYKDLSDVNATADCVRARFNYSPKQPDELELHTDDMIELIDRNLIDDGWWKGKNLRTNRIGVFPDNFVGPVENFSKDLDEMKRNQNELTNSNNTPLPNGKSVCTKTITLQNGSVTDNICSPRSTYQSNLNNHCNSKVNTPGNSDSAKPGVRSMPPNVTSSKLNAKTNPKTDSATNNALNVKLHKDNNNASNQSAQRYNGMLMDRPKQTGRRLPSKLSTITNMLLDNENQTCSERTTNPTLKSLNDNSSGDNNKLHISHHSDLNSRRHGEGAFKKNEDISKSNHEHALPTYGQFDANAHFTDSIQSTPNVTANNTITTNSNTSTTTTTTTNTNTATTGAISANTKNDNVIVLSKQRSKSPVNASGDFQTTTQLQIENLQNEMRQQVADLKHHFDALKESHMKLYSDWTRSQKLFTDRIHSLMDELDETKKLRAADSIELTRLRSVIKQIDADTILCTSSTRPSLTNHRPHTTCDKLLDNQIKSDKGRTNPISKTSDDNDDAYNQVKTNDSPGYAEANKTPMGLKPVFRSRPSALHNTPTIRP